MDMFGATHFRSIWFLGSPEDRSGGLLVPRKPGLDC